MFQKEQGQRIRHGRNGMERQLPELLDIHLDGLWEETRNVYGFNGFYYHGLTRMPFRDTYSMWERHPG